MLYDKNIFNTTAITGDFLNSDDSGLTTNVFLTDPKLIGIRVYEGIGKGDSMRRTGWQAARHTKFPLATLGECVYCDVAHFGFGCMVSGGRRSRSSNSLD